ncbi:MAG TPA: response regulator transcription factor [Drouetiella sp.]
MAKVLVADDDEQLRALVVDWLESQKFEVESVNSGSACKIVLENRNFDVMILDWQMPGLSGVDVCRWFRERGGTTPVLMLTAKDEIKDKEIGFGAGVDDYLTKPFLMRELSARLSALLRRGTVAPSLTVEVGPLKVDPDQHVVTVNGAPLKVSPTEFSILEFLARHQGQVFDTNTLLDRVWKSSADVSPDTVRVYIRRLRDKLTDAGHPTMLQNIHGVGYKLQLPD